MIRQIFFLFSLSRTSILPDIELTLLNYTPCAYNGSGKSDKTLKMSRDILTR